MNINRQLQLAIFSIAFFCVISVSILSSFSFFHSVQQDLEANTKIAMQKSTKLIEKQIDEIDILTEKSSIFSKNSYDLLSDLKKYTKNAPYTAEDFYYSEQEIKGIFRTLIYRMDNINFLAIVLPNGRVISYSNTAKDFIYGYHDLLNSNWYQETQNAKNELYLTSMQNIPFILNSNDQKTLFFSRNIYDFYSKELIGTLVVNCESSFFQLSSLDFPDKVIGLSLVNQEDKTILYEENFQDTWMTSTKTTDINVTAQKITLSVIIDNSEYLRLVGKLSIIFSLILVFILIAAYLISTKFSNSFTNPIIYLSNIMKKEASQELSISPELAERHDEIGTLFKEYEQMIKSLKRYMEEKLNYEQSLLKSELNIYKNQIDSHFLYNTLEIINSLAEIEDIEEISTMTVALSDMFRYTSNGFINEATLKEELKNVDDYLKIQRIRFQKKIDFVVINTTRFSLDIEIPKIILQPIIENAIYHGLNKGGIDGKIRLIIQEKQHKLLLRIIDNGIGIDEEKLETLQDNLKNASQLVREKTSHIGLINIQARIINTYSESFGMAIYSQYGNFTLVEIVLPVIPV